MAYTDYLESVQQLYVAYYGRPGEPAGLRQWAEAADAAGSVEGIVDAFGNSPEAAVLYEGMSSTEVVNSIYVRLFGRDAEALALTEWSYQIDSGAISAADAAWTIMNGAIGTDATAVDNKLTAANEFSNAIDTPEEILAYSGYSAVDVASAWLATVNDTAASLAAAEASLDTTIASLGTSETFTLTAYNDEATANIFEAPRVYTPGGTDSINSLQDDDVLTGNGVDPTLNFNYVNDADTGDYDIMPTLTGIETVNVTDSQNASGFPTLDLQDSTGILNLNLFRVDDGETFIFDNITEATTNNLSINDSQAPTANVWFTYLATAVSGTADEVTLSMNNAQVNAVVVEENKAIPAQGFETFNLLSNDAANSMTSLEAEDVRTLNISGDQDVSIFGTSEVIDDISGADLVEAEITTGGLLRMAGSLTLIDASGLTGNLNINLNNVLTATADGTSGTDVAVSVIGGSGDDRFVIGNGVGANDTIDGGTGGNTAVLVGGAIAGDITNTQTLEIRTDAAAVTVDTSNLPQLESILVRNEGNVWNAVTNRFESTATPVVVTLNNLTAAVAANGITMLHGTTYNNALTDLTLNADLATDGANDAVVYTLEDGVNSDPRFNVTITSTDFENVTIEDNDTESNTLALTGTKPATSLTITGGEAGDFINFDYAVAPELAATVISVNDRGIYGYDVADATTDDTDFPLGTFSGNDNGNDDLLADSGAAQQVYTSVDNYGNNPAAAVFTTTTIDATAELANVVIRVGSKESQTITMGAGDDTIVFDASIDRAADLSTEYAHAGLTNSDTVNGGEGIDTIAVDGESNTAITLQQSEWQNVTGIDQIYVVSNNGGTDYTNGSGMTAIGGNQMNYRIDVTDELIEATDDTTILTIRNDINSNASQEAAGTRNANLLLDLTHVETNNNNVVYNGAEGAVAAAVRVVFDDASLDGRDTIDGGDSFVADNGAGNDNVAEIQNSSTVTIADLAGLTNIDQFEFVNTLATAQTLNLDLNDLRLEALVDSNHTASATERETFTLNYYDSASAGSAVVVNSTAVTGNFDVVIAQAGVQVAADNDILRIGASAATRYNANLGTGTDTVEVYGSFAGIRFDDDTLVGPGAINMTMVDSTGTITGVVSGFTGVEVFNFANFTGSNATWVDFDYSTAATALTITGSAGADLIVAGLAADTITGGGGIDRVSYTAASAEAAVSAANSTGVAFVANTSITVAAGNTVGFDAVAGDAAAEVITDIAVGDSINFGNATIAAFSTNTNLGTGVALDDQASIVSGAYNAVTGLFTAAAGGADSLVIWDSNVAVGATTDNAVILVGVTSAEATAATIAAGVVTF